MDDGLEWGSDTSMQALQDSRRGNLLDAEDFRALAAQVRCPVVVVQGTADEITPPEHAHQLVEAIGDNASLVLFEGAGHAPYVRDPVRFSLLVR
jgi:pimeloyl-ACP methyl ester carboxylesterase